MIVELADGDAVSATVRGSGPMTLLLAHGAGTDQHHRSTVGIGEALAAEGVRVVSFNYQYTEAGRRRPDAAPKLLACHRAVADQIHEAYGDPLFLGGRSMGGRMATMLVAAGYPARGVVLYAYPLHPAGKHERLRIEHLPSITVPLLFFQGSRDALSRSDLFDEHIRPLPTATVVDMEGADHSFRGQAWREPELYSFLAERTGEWMRTVG